MADLFTKAKRSEIMSRIRSRDTKPEKSVRSLLRQLGYRFKLHVASLPGRPDIVLVKYRTVVLVHGCFWHRHSKCRYSYTPKTRVSFWTQKFAANQRRDRRVRAALKRLGWRAIVVWECETRKPGSLAIRLEREIKRSHRAT
jgi:DNA mismatch endonuclease (patch repair protein)